MERSVRLPTSLLLAVFLAACGGNPQPATPAPSAAPAAGAAAAAPTSPQAGLAGDWEVRIVPAQGGARNSTLRLTRRGESYSGVMQPLEDGERPYFVRGVTVSGQQVVIMLETEEGEARIQGVMRGANQIDGSFTSRRLVGRLTALRR